MLDSWPLTPLTILIPAPSCPLSPTSNLPEPFTLPFPHIPIFRCTYRSIRGNPISVWLSLITFLLLRLKMEEAITDQQP